ncbi:MAG: M15 family metallopeptidase, partial [Alphaproteobacteria bacterium]
RGERMHKSVVTPLKNMLAAAKKDKINITILSAFRSVNYQKNLFYGIAKKRNQTLEQRAKVSAPPGHSEHHTGYVFDFGDATQPVTDLETTFADTPTGVWLKKNAHMYGFEMSFPKDNLQGVSFEPWHWRYVGNNKACQHFHTARTTFVETATIPCATPK